jgi:hypothetical protein
MPACTSRVLQARVDLRLALAIDALLSFGTNHTHATSRNTSFLKAYFERPGTVLRLAINGVTTPVRATLAPETFHPDARNRNTGLFDAYFPPSGTIVCRADLRVTLSFHTFLVRLTRNVHTIQFNTLSLAANKVLGTIPILAFLHIAYATHLDPSVTWGGIKSAADTGIYKQKTQNPQKNISVPIRKHPKTSLFLTIPVCPNAIPRNPENQGYIRDPKNAKNRGCFSFLAEL